MRKHLTVGSQKSQEEMVYIEEHYLNFSCGECGERYQKPILVTMSANGNVQTYYACPHCLAKIDKAKTQKEEESKKVSAKAYRVPDAKAETGTKCLHHFGYLKNRPKNTPIPDECLTCDRMIECLTRR
jgi:predicted RNA-binding Zn-ribbon protein involved in translation (DUF1610 family)